MGVITESWGGWYEQKGQRAAISQFSLLITDGTKLSGSGYDVLGQWTWTGEVDASQQLVLRKLYVGGKPHGKTIIYTGRRKVSAGLEVIEGTWKLDTDSGPFFLEKQPHALEETYKGYYEQNGSQHTINTVIFTTSDNKLFGSGSDEIGEFTWTGEVNPTTGAVKLHKLYLGTTSSYEYTGTKSVKNGQTVIQGYYGNNDGNFFLGAEATPYTGPWTGWYEQNGQQHGGTNFSLTVQGSGIAGHGYDDLREFVWEGEVSGKNQIVLRKRYIGADGTPNKTDNVIYTGTIAFKDGKQVIDGNWNFPNKTNLSPFHFELPAPPALERPPYGIPVSIRSTSVPNAYLRLDGGRGQVNLQVGRYTYERFELVPQGEVGGEQVYSIKSLLFNHFLHLDPTVSEEQKPKSGTFHPKGVGRTSPVKAVDELTKFTVVVNEVEGISSFSFKLLNSGIPDLPKVFLRLNADKLSAAKTDEGSGEVNGQTYIGPFERLIIEPYPAY